MKIFTLAWYLFILRLLCGIYNVCLCIFTTVLLSKPYVLCITFFQDAMGLVATRPIFTRICLEYAKNRKKLYYSNSSPKELISKGNTMLNKLESVLFAQYSEGTEFSILLLL